MKENIIKLMTVKSLVTIIMTVSFALLSVRGIVTAEQFIMIYTTIIAFYFGMQHEKNSK